MPPNCPPVMWPTWPLPPRLLTRRSGVGLRPLHLGIRIWVEQPPVCWRSLHRRRSDEATNTEPHPVPSSRLPSRTGFMLTAGSLPGHCTCGVPVVCPGVCDSPTWSFSSYQLLPPRPFPLPLCHPYFIYFPAALLGVLFFLQMRPKAYIPGTLVPRLFQVW